MREILGAVLAASLSLGLASAAPAEPAPAATPDPASALAPLPSEARVAQSIRLDAHALRYTAVAGALPVFDAEGKRIGEVTYTAYLLDGADPSSRPVTFAFNGGPGSSSGFLNVGAIGPKRVQFGAPGDSASDPLLLKDNPATWLGFTDLVFIDPVGTGFSRSFVDPEKTRKAFYGIQQDVQYLSGVVFDWLKLNQRMASPKYLVGESYGGFRTPRIARELEAWRGVAVNGVVLISPYLDSQLQSPTGEPTTGVSPMPWIIDLPSMTAARYEAQGLPLTPELLAEVEDYAVGDYATTLMKGYADPAAFDRMVKRVAAYTGLDEGLVRAMGGRLEQEAFRRQRFASQGLVGSRYDLNLTSQDAFPWAPDNRGGDAVMTTFTAVGGAMTDLLTRVIGWKAQGPYWAYNPAVSAHWEGWTQNPDSVGALREILAFDPKFRVLIAHSYTDLSCPFFGSRLVVDQLPDGRPGGRLRLVVYPGGHMFYNRPGSDIAFRADVEALYRGRPAGGAQ
jgi:carboxypeptidase C (cathepsin A)